MPDYYEAENGLNSFDQRANSDGDGVTNFEECQFSSDPNMCDQDTNNNGVPDVIDQLWMDLVVPDVLALLLDEGA